MRHVDEIIGCAQAFDHLGTVGLYFLRTIHKDSLPITPGWGQLNAAM